MLRASCRSNTRKAKDRTTSTCLYVRVRNYYFWTGAWGGWRGGFADSAGDGEAAQRAGEGGFCDFRRFAAVRDDFGDGIWVEACGAELGAELAAVVE